MIVVEINHSRTASPSFIGSDLADRRIISVGYRYISLHVNSGKEAKVFKKNEYIFGFYPVETWGRWSMGSKSILLFPEARLLSGQMSISIDAHPYLEAFRFCNISIKISSGHYGSAKVVGSEKITIKLRRPWFHRSRRLVVGDFTKIHTPLNVSLSKETPKVSIIILNYDKPHLTLLASLATASSRCSIPFEILCADNGSSAECLRELRKAEVPIRLSELGENKGFGAANNIAAQEARGEYLLFLNNDAFIDQGAIDEMLLAYGKMSDCRIVGSVLRFPDGAMQEAGATIQSDAHPIRHGRGDPKFKTRSLPRFHPVDYVSGACLMIRKSDFLEMGGFDQKYAPAYYEDTDLCMRALLYGQKVYLASRANCYHVENATTSAIEDGAWATRTAEAHREIFLKDWCAYLASRDSKDLPWHLHQ